MLGSLYVKIDDLRTKRRQQRNALFWVVAVTLTFDHGLFGESIYGDGDMTQQQALFAFFDDHYSFTMMTGQLT